MKEKIVEIELLNKKNNDISRITIKIKIEKNINNSKMLKEIDKALNKIIAVNDFEIQNIWFYNNE